MAGLVLHCWVWVFSSCSKQGPTLQLQCGLLLLVLLFSSVQTLECLGLVVMAHQLSGSAPCGIFPAGIKHASLRWQGGGTTTGPPGKPDLSVLISLSMGTSIPLFIHLSSLPFICSFANPSTFPSIYLPSLSICPSNYPSICPCMYLFIHYSFIKLYSSVVDLQYYITFIF